MIRYSILPALSLESGVIHVEIVKGSFNTSTFNLFIYDLILKMNRYDPETHPSNSVIVLDNCRIHKDEEILQYIEDWYVFTFIIILACTYRLK